MSGVYTAQFNGVAVTAQQDLFGLLASSSQPLNMLGFTLSQTTEFGDAQEEDLLILVKSGQTTAGSGGSTPTPNPGDTANTIAAGFTAHANDTTKATAGTILTHASYAWNVRWPLEILFTEQQQILLKAARRFTIELAQTPTDSITMNGTVWGQEIG